MDQDVDESLSIQRQVQISAEEYGDLDPVVLALTLTMYRTTTKLDRVHAAELSPHGLTLGQFNVLTVLHRDGRPLTMTALGSAVAVRLGNLTGIVDALINRGLVSRQANPDDRRSLLVTISDAGGRFLADFLPGHWSYLQDLFSGLSADERVQLTGLLEKAADSIDKAGGPPPLRARTSTGSSPEAPALAPDPD